MATEIRGSLGAVWDRDGGPRTGYCFSTRCNNPSRYGLYCTIYNDYLRGGYAQSWVRRRERNAAVEFHELRHYAGSVWLEAGARMDDVSRMLGHSNIRTTQKHYIHYFKREEAERHREIANRVSAMHRLPAPTRDICEIDAEAFEILE